MRSKSILVAVMVGLLGSSRLSKPALADSPWIIQTVDSAADAGDTSIALDAAGSPHISYFDNTNQDLRYAAFDGSSWNIETVDSTGDVGRWTSLALDGDGYPHISYYDGTNVDLKYAAWNGSSWDFRWVDYEDYTGIDISLVLDASNNPQISYFGRWGINGAEYELKYAAFDGSSWDIETVESVYGSELSSISLALDAGGNAHISYPAENSNFYLRHAYVVTEPNIVVSPLSHDFGDVELGTSSTVIVTISNEGNGDLNVSRIALETDFAITSVPPASIVIEPNDTTDVEITYTPTVLGYNSAVLKITSDDPDELVVEVQLSAAGIEIPPSPLEQIAAILAFFDESVGDGSLVGDGPGNSAGKRLNALRNMIEAAGDLIENELYDEACQQLLDALKKTDGQSPPPDFVTGPAAEELAAMIVALRATLGC